MGSIDILVQRYIDDRLSLSASEIDELIAGLRADPELAISLREQLLVDDLLAQKLALDRRNFVAQIEQRIADLQVGQEAIGKQVADLSSMAAAEKHSAPGGGRRLRWISLAVALSALAVVGAAIYSVQSFGTHAPSLARVAAFEGKVTIGQEGEAEPAEVDGSVEGGQRIVVPRGGSIHLVYQDGTEIRVKGDSAVTFGEEQPGAAKQIRILRGEVVATVKPQAAGPMLFITPHAVAAAPASVLRLIVTDESTQLDMSEGKVKLERMGDKRMLMVAANESGMASRDTLQLRQLMWPDRRDGLTCLLSPLETATKEGKPLMIARNPATRSLRRTDLMPRGDATLLDSRMFYELNGGYLFSDDAGPDISAAGRGGSELTLEAVFCPASLDQAGPARILALADESDDPDFALAQDGSDVTFSLRTDARQSPAPAPRLTINTADTTLHLTVTYRHGELIAYRDGMEVARSEDLWGSLATWRSGPLTVGADATGEHAWRGIMEAFALYNRCLEPGEVARNARNYRLLAGRGM